MIGTDSNLDVVPQPVDVLGGSAHERNIAVALELGTLPACRAVGQVSVFRIQGFLINFATHAVTNFLLQKLAIVREFRVGQARSKQFRNAPQELEPRVVGVKLPAGDEQVDALRRFHPRRGVGFAFGLQPGDDVAGFQARDVRNGQHPHLAQPLRHGCRDSLCRLAHHGALFRGT